MMAHLTPVTGTVQHVLNQHDDTIVRVRRTTQRTPGSYHGIQGGRASNSSNYDAPRSETRTFVNRRREYSVIFEMDGQTYKFVDHDHIVLTNGDRIKGMWFSRRDGMRQFSAMKNVSRNITRRYHISILDVPSWFVFGLVGIAGVTAFLELPLAIGLVAGAVVVALYARLYIRRRNRARKINAYLDAPEP